MTNPSGVWPAPHAEDQYSHVVPQDSDACVSYSTVHSIESQIKFLTGQEVNYSERFLAKMSGTTLAGNSIENVVHALKTYGLVLDTDWPEPLSFTWQEYYAAIPQNIIDKGQEFLKQYDVSDVIYVADMNTDLQNAPLIIFTPAGTPTHAREVLSTTTIFDSYPPYTEAFPASVYGLYQVIIKPKRMPQFKTQNFKGELRIILQAADQAEWDALCKIYGVDPTKFDETV